MMSVGSHSRRERKRQGWGRACNFVFTRGTIGAMYVSGGLLLVSSERITGRDMLWLSSDMDSFHSPTHSYLELGQ